MKVLLVVSDWPWPPHKGHRLRALQLAEALAGEHELTLLAPAGSEAPPPGFAGRVERYGRSRWGVVRGLGRAFAEGAALQSALFRSRALERRLRELAESSDRVILQLARLGPALRAAGATPCFVDLVDSLSLNFERRALFERPWIRPWIAWEARRMARDERRLVAASAGSFVVCERDLRHLATRVGAPAEKLSLIPLAVAHAAPRESGPAVEAPPARPRLVVTGNLGYFPTADGTRWLLSEVWPRLRARRPELQLTIAGARPKRALAALAARAGAELVADPAELVPFLRRAHLALVPLRAGSGTPIKLLEAVAEGLPVVATPWAIAGVEESLGRLLASADAPEQWCAALDRLLADWPAARRRAGEARRILHERYGPERLRSELRSALF